MKRNCSISAAKPHSVKSDKYSGRNIAFPFNIFIIVIAVFTTIALMQSIQINRLLDGVKAADDSVAGLCAEVRTMSDHYSYYSGDFPIS